MSRVMVVDDDSRIRELFEYFVAKAGHELVGTAKDGQEAVDVVHEMLAPPDLILMDHRMPRMNGLQATREIRAEHPETKVLIVTADETILDHCIDGGACGYLEKPFTMDLFVETIDRVLAPNG